MAILSLSFFLKQQFLRLIEPLTDNILDCPLFDNAFQLVLPFTWLRELVLPSQMTLSLPIALEGFPPCEDIPQHCTDP